MIPDDRRREILSILEKKNFVEVKELARRVHVSEPTIRRDLRELESENLIKRRYGGASFISEQALEWPFAFRKRVNLEQKMYIAGLAVEYLRNNDTVFLDAGSTCYCLAQKMKGLTNVHVITNSVPATEILGEMEGIEVNIVSGRYHPRRHAIFGTAAHEYIRKHRARVCFLGGYSIIKGYGMMQESEDDAMIKKAYSENADMNIVLFDSSKFEKRSFFQAVPFERISAIVTDKPLGGELSAVCREYGIEVVY